VVAGLGWRGPRQIRSDVVVSHVGVNVRIPCEIGSGTSRTNLTEQKAVISFKCVDPNLKVFAVIPAIALIQTRLLRKVSLVFEEVV